MKLSLSLKDKQFLNLVGAIFFGFIVFMCTTMLGFMGYTLYSARAFPLPVESATFGLVCGAFVTGCYLTITLFCSGMAFGECVKDYKKYVKQGIEEERGGKK